MRTKEEIFKSLADHDNIDDEGCFFDGPISTIHEAMETHAKEVAIAFKLWVDKNFSLISNGKYIHQDFIHNLDKYYTLEELFNQFINQKP